MTTSILEDTKKVLGIDKDAIEFDTDIVMHVNTAFFQLMQLGVGPKHGFTITDETQKWDDFFQGRKDLEAVKSYIFVVVRLVFDRPETSYGIQALEKMRDEWAWRLEIQRREIWDDLGSRNADQWPLP